MDQETHRSCFTPRLTPADNCNLQGANEFIAQSHLVGGLTEDQTANDEMLKNLDLREEDTTNKQFVLHEQCVVLGDSGVGKTSLVKSLTGKPFDPRQPQTQGIEQSLVDEKWEYLSMKDLIFGNQFWRLQDIIVQFTLYRPEISFYFTSLLVLSIGEPFLFLIYLLAFVLYFVLLYFVTLISSFRLTAARRRLLMAAFLLIIVLCYYGYWSANADGMLLNVTVQGVLVSVLVNQWFRSASQCSYLRQRKLIKYHRDRYIDCLRLFAEMFALHFLSLVSALLTIILMTWFLGVTPFRIAMIVFIPQFTFKLEKLAQKLPTRAIHILVLLDIISLIISQIICSFIPLNTSMNTLCNTFRSSITVICMCLDWMELLERGNKKAKSTINKKFASLKLKILDFAGDKEYYTYHHVFLRRKAINIIVFNMADFVVNGFREIDSKVKRLQFWFDSVCGHVPPGNPIFLVGTHRGSIDENCIEILDGHLRRYFWNPHCDELVVNNDGGLIFFPVENSNGKNDIGVQCLQTEIDSVAEVCKKTIGHYIPLSWIRMQDAVISFREEKEAKFCVTIGEFSRIFDTSNSVICTNCGSKETLKYFHEKGLVIYLDRNQDLDLFNWVLLKPEIMVDIIIQLVTPSPEIIQQRGLRHHRRLLQKKGLLTKALLRSIISKVQENEEPITAFLEEYDLICPLTYKKVKTCSLQEDHEQPTHFVPSLLPMAAEGEAPIWYDDDTDKTFYVFFTRFLTEPLFHRLLSRAHKRSKLEFLNGQTVVFRDAAKFWMSPWQPYCLKLIKEEKMIEVKFSCRTNHRMKPSDVLCQVFSMVDGVCRRDFPFVKFHCGPACPSHKCPGHQPDYLSYSAGEEQGPRRHVYNVMPGRQGDNTAFLYCKDYSFEEELDEWVP